MRSLRFALPLVLLLVVNLMPSAAFALSDAELKSLLQRIDERQRSTGDYKARVFIHTKEKGKDDVAYEAAIYRRDDNDKFMILFLKPKAERGKGYLRMNKNLWLYDPTVGRWDRRTERERIAGTDSRRADFDESRLAEEYDAVYVGEEKLGRFTVHHLKLKAKEGVDVAYPGLELWIDAETDNVLKSQEFAASSKLMRTVYTPKWMKVFSETKKEFVWYPGEIRIYDEVEKDNSTVIVMKSVSLKPLPSNIFTKAWLEGKSR